MSLPDIAVVIPAYKVSAHIKEVILHIPDSVGHVIVVDDKCPESSGREAELLQKKNVIVLYHEQNEGVGAAVVTGYKKALALGCDVVVKMDGDGQMDPKRVDNLVRPLLKDEADYAKGNRFRDFHALKTMPRIRLFGNSILSFFVKAASGYWDIMDPTNGYTAIHRRVLEELNVDRLSKRFFFESDMLIQLNIINAVVRDVSMPAHYGEEKSSLKIARALVQFPPRLMMGLVKRTFLKYFLYDFNMASVYILIGLPIFVLSVVYGIIQWVASTLTGIPRSAGTIMLVALPIIISFQMLLQAVQIDILAVPKKK
jgi:glycosyltransferase involved in cell wall biosynthesis